MLAVLLMDTDSEEDLLSELIAFVSSVDDEYLVGISNKGIVKRSYKDLEKERVELSVTENECKGKLMDIEVTLSMPLSDSRCSCPAHGICKHIVMTIITLKNNSAREETSTDALNDAVTQSNTDGKDIERSDSAKAVQHLPSMQELKKDISNKEFVKIVEEIEGDEKVDIWGEDIITVKDAAAGTIVKLAFPIRNSVCSCHSDKLCRHKVKAILLVKLARKEIEIEDLIKSTREAGLKYWDADGIKEVIRDVRKTLTDIVMTGSSRMSPELPLGLERLAIRCHNVMLADMETQMRILSELTACYNGRRARVKASNILRVVSEIYLLSDAIEDKLLKGEDITSLAGSFRSEYTDVKELHLSGMGMRHFVSVAGFEGETIYFLEDSGEWYTYTVARPTIYDRKKRRSNYSEAPWGLPCTLNHLAGSTIVLRGGKANSMHRLSSTSKATADLMGESNISEELISDHIYDDFAKLWEDYCERISGAYGKFSDTYGDGSESISEADKLFLIRPKRIFDMNYDEVGQRLVFYLEDSLGRTLKSQITYSKEEAAAIKSLESIKRNIEKGKDKMPVFLGIIYVEDGECVMYPIETL